MGQADPSAVQPYMHIALNTLYRCDYTSPKVQLIHLLQVMRIVPLLFCAELGFVVKHWFACAGQGRSQAADVGEEGAGAAEGSPGC